MKVRWISAVSGIKLSAVGKGLCTLLLNLSITLKEKKGQSTLVFSYWFKLTDSCLMLLLMINKAWKYISRWLEDNVNNWMRLLGNCTAVWPQIAKSIWFCSSNMMTRYFDLNYNTLNISGRPGWINKLKVFPCPFSQVSDIFIYQMVV